MHPAQEDEGEGEVCDDVVGEEGDGDDDEGEPILTFAVDFGERSHQVNIARISRQKNTIAMPRR